MKSVNSTFQERREYFFGEKYRTCFYFVHIVTGAQLILILDIIKLFLETYYFITKNGFIDAVTVVQLSWALIGYTSALIAFIQEKAIYLWPFLSLKVTECLFGIISLFIITILIFLNSFGNPILIVIIRWKYRRIEADEAVKFLLILFVIFSLLLVFNFYVFDIFFRTHRYFQRKSMAIYLDKRSEIIRNII